MKYSLFSMLSLYALIVIACIFAAMNFIESLLPALTGGDGYNDPLSSKIFAFVLFAIFFGLPIGLLAFTAEGYKTGEEKYFKRGRWGAGIIGGAAVMICTGYLFNPNSGLDKTAFVIALVTAILAIVVLTSTLAWNTASAHQVVHITLRNGKVIKVDRIGEAPF